MKRYSQRVTNGSIAEASAEKHPGVEASRQDLVKLRAAARCIDLGRPGRVSSLLSGPHLSPFRGRGMEFTEVRQYVAGDEVRHIDWRVTARTGVPHSKLFDEERERPLIVVSDARFPMRFGTRQCFKSVAAARWAALLVWAAIERGDRVGGVTLTDEACRRQNLRRDRNGTMGLISNLADATATALDTCAVSLTDALQETRRIACVGAEVFILSDFADLDTESSRNLAHLARFTDTTCILVHDPLEAEAPAAGQYRVSNGQQVVSLGIGNRASRETWVKGFKARSHALEKICHDNRAALGFLSTASDLLGFTGLLPNRASAIAAVPGLGTLQSRGEA